MQLGSVSDVASVSNKESEFEVKSQMGVTFLKRQPTGTSKGGFLDQSIRKTASKSKQNFR